MLPVTVIEVSFISNITRHEKFWYQTSKCVTIFILRNNKFQLHEYGASTNISPIILVNQLRLLFSYATVHLHTLIFFGLSNTQNEALTDYVTNKRFSLLICDSGNERNYNYGRILESTGIIGETPSFLTVSRPQILGSIRGQHVKVSSYIFSPYVEKNNAAEKREEKWDGSNYRLLHHASARLNFSYNLHANSQPRSGAFVNGTWVGEYGDIFYDNFNLGILFSPDQDTHRGVDVICCIGMTPLLFTTAKPHEKASKSAIIQPYTTQSWFLIVCSFMLTSLSLSLAVKLHPYRKYAFGRSNTTEVLPFCIAFALFFEQPASLRKHLRRVAIIWILSSFLFVNAYRATLASFLLRPDTERRPTTFSELNDAPDYKIYFEAKGKPAIALLSPNKTDAFQSDLIRGLSQRVVHQPDSSKCILKALLEPKSVCIGWQESLQLHIASNATLKVVGGKPMFISQDTILRSLDSFFLQKNSIFTETFRDIISTYYESGVYTRWRHDVISKYMTRGIHAVQANNHTNFYKRLVTLLAHTQDRHSVHEKPLTRQDVRTVYMLYSVCVCITVVILLLERWIQ
ncbi:unnamed protein product [Orchesella dallaii]|uniref:Ionotropic glutamate receptor C-terminal domain-containing protein n=1 Tax=Orchesella dallaii TaxID=48710 RepID=A0ABP1PL50_9HEXA